MERLTERFIDGEAFSEEFMGCTDVGVEDTIYKGKIIDKLADYRQTRIWSNEEHGSFVTEGTTR